MKCLQHFSIAASRQVSCTNKALTPRGTKKECAEITLQVLFNIYVVIYLFWAARVLQHCATCSFMLGWFLGTCSQVPFKIYFVVYLSWAARVLQHCATCSFMLGCFLGTCSHVYVCELPGNSKVCKLCLIGCGVCMEILTKGSCLNENNINLNVNLSVGPKIGQQAPRALRITSLYVCMYSEGSCLRTSWPPAWLHC